MPCQALQLRKQLNSPGRRGGLCRLACMCTTQSGSPAASVPAGSRCLNTLTAAASLLLQLACSRIAAVFSVIFAGFSAESLAGRLADPYPK